MGVPRTPSDLGTRGRKLFREVVKLYELDPQDVSVLHEAARTLDEIDVMRQAVARDGATATGSTGQVVEHPCLSGLRAHSATLDKLLVRLGLPDGDGDVPLTAFQQRSKAGHDARWGHRRAQAEERIRGSA